MRARIYFELNGDDHSLLGKLIRGKWWAEPSENTQLSSADRREVDRIISKVQSSVDPKDAEKFEHSKKKYAVKHRSSQSEGVISDEGRWILRLHNENVSPLQDACSIFISLVRVPHNEKQKLVDIYLPIEIVEDNKSVQLIDGYPLIDKEDRKSYVKKHRNVEKWVMYGGTALLAFLLAVTFPGNWSVNSLPGLNASEAAWLLSIFEKMIGSVTVATLLAAFQYLSFKWSLRTHTIKWEIHEQ